MINKTFIYSYFFSRSTRQNPKENVHQMDQQIFNQSKQNNEKWENSFSVIHIFIILLLYLSFVFSKQ